MDTAERRDGLHLRLSEVTVCAVPEDSVNHHLYAVTVAWRGGEDYAVIWFKRALGRDGEWDWEPIPSEREDSWLREHRFDYWEALRRACEVAPTIVVNGRIASEIAREGEPDE